MKILRTVRELQEASAEATSRGQRVGIVPTMGALHAGHLSLVAAAREQCDLVIMSIFVNPKQFTEAADLDRYPRQEAEDLALAEQAGVDVVFAPAAAELYPQGFATSVRVSGPLTETLEGAGRGSGHFDGVATVVSKLLLAASPVAAFFGQKDAQQLLVVQRMVADLGIPTRIVACPTLRDHDGLALSSRNVLLSRADRAHALAIPRALETVRGLVTNGEQSTAQLRAAAEEILGSADIVVEYLAFVEPHSLAPVAEVAGETLCAIAARVGPVRLIDNVLLRANATPETSHNSAKMHKE